MNSFKDSLVSHFSKLGESIVTTGIKRIDFSCGFQHSKLVVISGMPSSGKTSFALSIAHNAVMSGLKVAVISKQMTREEIDCRFISYESCVPLTDVMYNAELSEEYKQSIFEAIDKFEDKEIIYMNDRSALHDICFVAEKLKQNKQKLDLVIVDSYQLFNRDFVEILDLYESAKSYGFCLVIVSDIEKYDKSHLGIFSRRKAIDDKLFALADMVIYVSRFTEDLFDYQGDTYGKALIDIVKSRYTREFEFFCNYDNLTTRFSEIDNTKQQEDPLEDIAKDLPPIS